MSQIEIDKLLISVAYLDSSQAAAGAQVEIDKLLISAAYLIDYDIPISSDTDVTPADDGYIFNVTPGGNIVKIRIPPQSEQAFQAGHQTTIVKKGGGTVIIVAGEGVILNGVPKGQVEVTNEDDPVIIDRGSEDDWSTIGNTNAVLLSSLLIGFQPITFYEI